jgi:hypothetical protein
MAQAFIGLRVSITLNTGLSLEGKVSHIDSDSQLLTLNDGKPIKVMLVHGEEKRAIKLHSLDPTKSAYPS